jgi:hypothetical protein
MPAVYPKPKYGRQTSCPTPEILVLRQRRVGSFSLAGNFKIKITIRSSCSKLSPRFATLEQAYDCAMSYCHWDFTICVKPTCAGASLCSLVLLLVMPRKWDFKLSGAGISKSACGPVNRYTVQPNGSFLRQARQKNRRCVTASCSVIWSQRRGGQAIGRNYADHIKELKNTAPKEPFFFLKPTSSYVPSGGRIEIPKGVIAHHEGMSSAVLY